MRYLSGVFADLTPIQQQNYGLFYQEKIGKYPNNFLNLKYQF